MQDLYCGGFWKRIAAFIIDFIILYTLTPLFMALICVFSKISPPTPTIRNPIYLIVLGTIFVIISWLYFAFTESSQKQSSLGKRILKLIVTDLQGNRITFLKASLRFWGKFVFFPGFSLTGLIIKNKSWHDIFAKTLVVNKYVHYTDNIS